jgi:hypothetical protein
MKSIGACVLASMFFTIDAGADPGKAGDGRPLAPVAQLPMADKPSAGLVRLNPAGQVVLKFWSVRHERVVATRVIRDGKEIDEKVVFYQPVAGWQETLLDIDDIRLLRSDGTDIEKKSIGFLLKSEQPVLYTIGEARLDPTYFKIIKKETLILILNPQRVPVPVPAP